MTITKADLAESVYKQHESFTKKDATEAVEAFLRISKRALIEGSDLLLSGFGKFNVNDKRARLGRNPQTGERLMLEKRRVITFKPSGRLREKISASSIKSQETRIQHM